MPPMNSELLPATSAKKSVRSRKVDIRLTRSQLALLDRFCAENELSRGQVARRALKEAYLQRSVGQGE